MLLDKCPTAQALPQLRMVALWFSKLVNLEDIEGLDEAATACRPGLFAGMNTGRLDLNLSLIHISEPTRRVVISYAVFCLKKKK